MNCVAKVTCKADQIWSKLPLRQTEIIKTSQNFKILPLSFLPAARGRDRPIFRLCKDKPKIENTETESQDAMIENKRAPTG